MKSKKFTEEAFEIFKKFDIYFIPDNFKKAFKRIKKLDFSALTPSNKTIINKIRKAYYLNHMTYIQNSLYKAMSICSNKYGEIEDGMDIIRTAIASIFISFRDTVCKSLDMPCRYKSNKSTFDNLNKEIMGVKEAEQNGLEVLTKLDISSSKEDIDAFFENAILSTIKDFYGATLVFNNSNDLHSYVKSLNGRISQLKAVGSEDSKEYNQILEIFKLYSQYCHAESYYTNSLKPHSEQVEFFDSKNTFIDDIQFDFNVPDKLYCINTDINTLEDYYNQLISLLTISMHLSIPLPKRSRRKRKIYSKRN